MLELVGVRPAHNTYFTMLALPSPVSRVVYERAAQLMFEAFNAPALCICEIPLLSAYAAGVLNAMVLDIGAEESSATVVSDCAVVPTGVVVTKLGVVHCTFWLAHLLRQDAAVCEALSPVAHGQLDAAAWALAQQLVADGHVRVDASIHAADEVDAAEDEGTFDVAAALVEGRERDVVAEQERRKQQDAAAAQARSAGAAQSHDDDAVTVTFRGASVRVGRARTRFHEPLLRPALLERVALDMPTPRAVSQALQARRIGGTPPCVSLPEVVRLAVNNVVPMERRVPLWESVIITGRATQTRGVAAELVHALSAYVTNDATEAAQVVGEPNPLQPRTVRALKVPDYFAAFKERMDLAGYLGATIYAKLVFGDLSGRNYITKKQYSDGGPSVAFAIGSV